MIPSFTLPALLAAVIALFTGSFDARADTPLSTAQTIYVPAYSHIYSGDSEKPFLLAVTLSVRNTDPKNAMQVTEVGNFDTDGKLLKNYITDPIPLSALQSTRFVVGARDDAGGSGANFIVKWVSTHPINSPIVETVMIGTQSQQGISFTSRGQVIQSGE